MGRFFALALLLQLGICAQEVRQSTTYTYGVNGERQRESGYREVKTGRSAVLVQTRETLNGRVAPMVRVEEHVIRDDASSKVVERAVRSYDANDAPLPLEKTVVEEAKHADGSSRTITSYYRGDLNGNLRLEEKAVAETTVSGGVEQTQSVIRRLGVNGGLEVAEKQVATSKKVGTAVEKELVVYRPGTGDGFQPAYREVSRAETANGETTEQSQRFDAAVTGKLELTGEVVTQTVSGNDGSETKQVTIYGVASPGRTAHPGEPRIREQQLIERRPTGWNTVVETFSIRRPSLSDQQLGKFVKISETVCTGCTAAKP